MLEPRFQQFHASIITKIQYPTRTTTNDSKVPVLDSAIIKVLSGLHGLNNAVYQMAVVVLGEEALLSEKYFVPLFDIDGVARPYLKAWIEGLCAEMANVVTRCVDNDKEDAVDDALK